MLTDATGESTTRGGVTTRFVARRPSSFACSPSTWSALRLATFVLAWAGLAFGLSQLIFLPVQKLVASRCETIAQYY